ncbi:expressed unknown protein [Seminavis robusta]|uniref:Uncharacterized protein n=1 Tax=Seminavis robusta TaxID=568900 RepID=A0A9N8HPK2_9STRA|nr:expressed unknown protein [Seminavis robusta]|eukprot:Sro1099_g241090.1 n/a (101) ;mRNA; f:13758-14157
MATMIPSSKSMHLPRLALLAILLCSSLHFSLAGRIPTTRTYVRGRSRGTVSLRHRSLLHPMHHGHGGTSYLGCLNYTDTELSSEWKFSGNAPDCSYVSYG